MKRKIMLTGIYMLLLVISYGQSTKFAIESISNSEVSKISPYLDSQIEICILEEPDFVSKQEAIAQLSKFLKKVKPISFESFHQGSSKSNGSKYAVANLITQQGTYRVFVYSEEASGKQIIREIRIDKE
jgi:hypothetical protein